MDSDIAVKVDSSIDSLHPKWSGRREKKMDRTNRTRQLALASFFLAIETIMAITPIGFIPVGVIRITTMHIPVLLASLVMGPKWGAMIGFVFGLSSMLKATFAPNITSFCFSPFITIGGVSGNFSSILIAFGPRILLGVLPYYMNKALCAHRCAPTLAAGITAGVNTFIHTILVMGMIGVFFGTQYAQAAGITVGAVILTVLASNGILEILLAAIVIPALVRALSVFMNKKG